MLGIGLTAALVGLGPGLTRARAESGGWRLTVYYTPGERYFSGPPQNLVGCAGRDLGTHPVDFLATVQTEGYGALTSPIRGAGYLAWDFDRHCWYPDTAPRNAQGDALVAWQSAAADAVYAFNTGFRVTGCGIDSGNQVEPNVCTRLQRTRWMIADRGDTIGGRHLDLYIGDQDRADMSTSPYWLDTLSARTTLSRFPARFAPDTRITKTTISAHRHTAAFRFISTRSNATHFDCALVRASGRPSYRACRSLRAYKHLPAGRYTFLVRAINAAGHDPTPAIRRFRMR